MSSLAEVYSLRFTARRFWPLVKTRAVRLWRGYSEDVTRTMLLDAIQAMRLKMLL